MATLSGELPPKRRKIRKGTTSCWECKKRKTRCRFPSSERGVCEGCARRRTACLTQEYDDAAVNYGAGEDSSNGGRGRHQDDTSVGLGTQARRSPSTGTTDSSCAPSPSTSIGETAASGIEVFDSVIVYPDSQGPEGLRHNTKPAEYGRYRAICRKLYAALPSQRDSDLIIAAGNTCSFLQFFTLPYHDLFRGNMRSASSISALPSVTSHPVLLARTSLYLAHGIQNLHPSTFDMDKLSFRSPAKVMKRLLDTATKLVTSNEELLSSLEGLECLILEGTFHINAGNLRRAWLAFRRALGLAQLMGLHYGNTLDLVSLDSESMASPSFMWYRIVHQDRYLALMLGLPSGTGDTVIAVPASLSPGDCASEYLERVHCTIMGQIIARNNQADTKYFSKTQEIDLALQKASQSMSSGWWLLPSPKRRRGETLEDVLRILVHITHFHLLILLHLPYMLRTSPERSYGYSKVACVNASRELLNRYIRFRCMSQAAFCCRIIDFSAFVACLTLLLAHLDRWRHEPNTVDVLPHQRQSDKATVEEVAELMRELNEASSDVLLGRTACIVMHLSRLESDVARSADELVAASSSASAPSYCLHLEIPYLGRIKITRNGISKAGGLQDESQFDFVVGNNRNCSDLFPADSSANGNMGVLADSVLPELQIDDFPNMRDIALDPIAGAEDWALQGMDGPFLANLLATEDGLAM